MQERIRGNEYRTTVVCVDSYHQGTPVSAGIVRVQVSNMGQVTPIVPFSTLT